VANGAGPHLALVLLHEGPGSLELWQDVPAVLASLTGRQVVVWSRAIASVQRATAADLRA
jgi:hypothetical protein